MSKLAEKIDVIMRDCLYTEDELSTLPKGAQGAPEGTVIIEGVVRTYGLHPERLERHREEVRELLDWTPEAFHAGSDGGGHSFLNMCVTRDGDHWGEHRDMESLIVLGIGLGFVKYCMPRDMWKILPGGMPYLTIDTRPDHLKGEEE